MLEILSIQLMHFRIVDDSQTQVALGITSINEDLVRNLSEPILLNRVPRLAVDEVDH